MVDIVKQEYNTIYYTCECGVKGVCSFKPEDKEAAIVVDVRCPSCMKSKRLTVLQYRSDSDKKELLNNIDDIDLSWVPTFNEEI